jgi:hypothetical protein
MVDGRYNISLQTPIGSMRGNIILVTDGEKLSGFLEINGGRHPFSGGTVQGENCSFASNFRTPFGSVRVEIRATVHDDLFKATGRTSMGMITATGHRVNKK